MGILATFGSDGYNWLLGLHILCAAVWVGSGVVIQVLVIRARNAGPEQLAYLAGEVEWYGMRFLTVTSFLLMLLGFGLLSASDGLFDLSQAWVSIGFGVWILSFLAGITFLGPESGKLSKLLEERGADDPEYKRRLGRIFIVSRIELVLLIVVVLDMAIKPGLN